MSPRPVSCGALKAVVIVSESVFKLRNHFHKLPWWLVAAHSRVYCSICHIMLICFLRALNRKAGSEFLQEAIMRLLPRVGTDVHVRLPPTL